MMRRRATGLLLGLVMLAAGGRSVQAQSGPVCPDLDDSAAPIAARVGEQFVVGLQANPTTGYRWQVEEASLGGIVRFVGSEYVAAQQPTGAPPLAGSGGKECLTFEATATGTATVRLTYRRSFEPPSIQPVTTKPLTVNVAPSSAPAQVPSR